MVTSRCYMIQIVLFLASVDLRMKMAVTMRSHAFVSLKSTEDGSLIHETRHHHISQDLLAFENRLELYCSAPSEDTLYLNVIGTGLCLVSVCDGRGHSVPLYQLNFRNKYDLDLKLDLNKQRKQVISTFNGEMRTTEVEQEKSIQAKLTILEGQFTSTFSMNDKVLLKQTCAVAVDDNRTGDLGTNQADKVSLLNDTKNNNEYVTDDPDFFSNCYNVNDYTKNDESNSADVSEYSSDKENDDADISESTKNEKNGDDVYGAGKDEKENDKDDKSDCDDEVLEVLAPPGEEFGITVFKTEASTYTIYDRTVPEELRTLRCTCTRNRSTSSSLGISRDRLKEKVRIETDIVDIRTHRTKLLKIMPANVLSDYFFEAALISEENMIDINEFWNKRDIRAANSCLLNILRNRQIPKGDIALILIKAEEQHLLPLMFPRESKLVSVGTQTEASFVNKVMT